MKEQTKIEGNLLLSFFYLDIAFFVISQNQSAAEIFLLNLSPKICEEPRYRFYTQFCNSISKKT